MAERSYFSYRWAVPGYTTILLIITLNYSVLLRSFGEQGSSVITLSQLFLGVLVLLSGSGIGFLISQIWHLWYESLCLYYGKPFANGKARKPYMKMIELYKLEKGDENRNDKQRISTFYVYLLNSSTENNKISDFLSRRWDLYHLFGSEMTSLILGLFFAWIIRIISHFYLNKSFIFLGQNLWNTTEAWVLIFTTVFPITFFVILWRQKSSVEKQYDNIAELNIMNIHKNIKRDELLKVFSRKYFKWPLNKLQIPNKYEQVLNEAGIVTIHHLSEYDIEKDPKKILPKTSKDISKDELTVWIKKAEKFLDEYEILNNQTLYDLV